MATHVSNQPLQAIMNVLCDCLKVSVYRRARLGQDLFLGDVVIPLSEIDNTGDSSRAAELRRYTLGRQSVKDKVCAALPSGLIIRRQGFVRSPISKLQSKRAVFPCIVSFGDGSCQLPPYRAASCVLAGERRDQPGMLLARDATGCADAESAHSGC